MALLSLRDRNPDMMQKAINDPQFNVNTQFKYVLLVIFVDADSSALDSSLLSFLHVDRIRAASPRRRRTYGIIFGRVAVEILEEKTKSGVKKDVTFDAPSHTRTGRVFKSVEDCYNFQDWFADYDTKVGPLHQHAKTNEDGVTRHDSLIFTIIRQGYFIDDGGRSTGILEMLAKISTDSRRYPDLKELDGQGKDIYDICEAIQNKNALKILEKAFPRPSTGEGCCVVL